MAKKPFALQYQEQNTALRFISAPVTELLPARTPLKPLPETRCRRVHVLVKPSLYQALTTAAQTQNVSANELINRALTAYMDES